MKCSPSTLPQTTHLFLQNHLPFPFTFQRWLLPGLSIKSFSKGSAPGPSGLRANHLKEAVFCPSPDRANHALHCLMKLVNLLWAGIAPGSVISHLCGASLLPCKKDGGLCPIAIGEVLHRLTSKCAARSVQSEALGILAPLQLGVGIPAGCKAIVHAVSNVLEDSNILPDNRFILLVDFSNALTLWITPLYIVK